MGRIPRVKAPHGLKIGAALVRVSPVVHRSTTGVEPLYEAGRRDR